MSDERPNPAPPGQGDDAAQQRRRRRRQQQHPDAVNIANDLMSSLTGVLPAGSTARVINGREQQHQRQPQRQPRVTTARNHGHDFLFPNMNTIFQSMSGSGFNVVGFGREGDMDFNQIMGMMMGGAIGAMGGIGPDRGPNPNAPASDNFIEELPLYTYSDDWYRQWVDDRVQYLMLQHEFELGEKANKETTTTTTETKDTAMTDGSFNLPSTGPVPIDSLTLPTPTVNEDDSGVVDETALFTQHGSVVEESMLSPNDTNANQVQFKGDLAAYELQLREQLKEFECQICMIDFETDDLITHLPCDHWYHYRCIEPWLKQRNTCPSCRALADRGDSERRTGNAANGNNTPRSNLPASTNGVYHLPIQPLSQSTRDQLDRSLRGVNANGNEAEDGNEGQRSASNSSSAATPPRPIDTNPFTTYDFEFTVESFDPAAQLQQQGFYVHQYQAQEHQSEQSVVEALPKWEPEVNTFSDFNNAKLYATSYHQ